MHLPLLRNQLRYPNNRIGPCPPLNGQVYIHIHSSYLKLSIQKKAITNYNLKSPIHPLKVRNLNPLPTPIKLNLLPRNKRLLQRTSNSNSLNSRVQPQRRLSIIQARSSKLIRLGNKRLTEASVIIGGDLAPDAGRLVQVDEVELGLGVDGDFAVCTEDFSAVFLAGGHHAGAVELGDFAALLLQTY